MVFGGAPVSAVSGLMGLTGELSVTDDAAHAWQMGNVGNFGSYPQTRVMDSATLSALNALTLDWTSYGYYSGTNKEGTQAQSDYMKYADAVYDGSRYRAVRFTSYRPNETYYLPTASRSSQDENGYVTNTVYWFKYEPIKWRVLDPSAGLVIAENIVDSQEFYPETPYPAWADSNVRAWLNGTFFDTAFTSTEQSYIVASTVSTPAYAGISGGADTTDKLFLLSREEAMDTVYGFSTSATEADISRQAQGSDYAKSQGLVGGNSGWWLRSPGYNVGNASCVNSVGSIYPGNNVCCTDIGVRPVFRVSNLSFLTCDVTGVSLEEERLALTAGDTVQLTAQAEPPNAVDTSVVWASDNTAVATVDDTGLVTAVAAGTAAITVMTNDGGYTDTCLVTVNAAHDWQAGDTGTFGRYPQTRVMDSATLSALNDLTLTWIPYGYYSGTGGWGTQVQSGYMKYADISYKGDRYRAVRFTSYRPFITYYASSEANSWQDENGYVTNTVYWFKYEPLIWRVLDVSTGLLMAEDIIDSGYLHHISPYPAWTNSNVRAWLNGVFYESAFSYAERERVSDSTVFTPASNGGVGIETTDKVFLLSREEAVNTAYGFNPSGMAFDPARAVQGSDYARCQGLNVSTQSEDYGYSDWWLRSPGYISADAGYVNRSGDIYPGKEVSYTDTGICPVFKISNLSYLVYMSSVNEPVTGVSINEESLSVTEGCAARLTVAIEPSWAANKSVVWSSSDTDVATVDHTGLVTAVAPGTAMVTVKTNDGGFTDTCEVTVMPAVVTSIEIKTMPIKLYYYVGDTLDTAGLTLSATYNNGITQTISSGFDCTPMALDEQDYMSVTVTFCGQTCTFDVVVFVNANDFAVTAIPDQMYTGEAITPEISVFYNGCKLIVNTDYTIAYVNNINPGTATVTITGRSIQLFMGTKQVTFKIIRANASSFDVAAIPDQTYTGSAVTPALTVKYNGETLMPDTDYTVEYADNINVGTATATITGIGIYNGTKSAAFTIVKASADDFDVAPIPDQVYTGGALTPTAAVTFDGETLTLNTDYTVSYSSNINIGTATLTITGIGSFEGTKTVTFKIVSSDITVTGITMNRAALSMRYKDTEKLTVTFSPTDATNKNVTWTSDNREVATVDSSGNVTAKGRGTVTITATSEDGGHKAICDITVTYAWWQWLIKILLFGWIWY
jgi:uncharacterized protein YjdB